MFGQFCDTLLSERHAFLAFKIERLGHHGHCQNTQVFSNFSDDWRCTGTGTAAHAGCNEDHVCTIQCGAQGFTVFFR
ncbi:hypothetical protein D3C85_1752920 [compost metagenome]